MEGQSAVTAPSMAGAEYVQAMASSPSVRIEREFFQKLTLLHLRPGSNVFDFGSGPGIDALFYAGHGHRVAAYDVDPAMRTYFDELRRESADAERITQCGGTFQEFLDSDFPTNWADLIASNFAPLNLVDDLHLLFRRFHGISKDGALVLASVLNPGCVRDAKYGWWWRNLCRYVRTGEFHVVGRHGRVYRRSLGTIERAASPYFELLGAIAVDARALHLLPREVSRVRCSKALRPSRCRYMVVVLRRNEAPSRAI